MAGVAATYFTQKQQQYQEQVTATQQQISAAQQQAETAAAKVQFAAQGLRLLEKANPIPADLETLIDLYQKAE